MTLETIRTALLYCTFLNFALLGFWSLLTVLAGGRLYPWIARVVRVPSDQMATINFAGIVVYKMGILLFNLVPYLALRGLA